jgi:hypothetical protein
MRKNKNASSILKARPLTLEDMPWLRDMGEINNGSIFIQRSAKGFKLKKPVHVQTKKILALGQAGLAKYIIQSLSTTRPGLIPFVLDNQSLIKMANYFLRSRTGSAGSLFGYTDRIWRYSNRVEKTPDSLVEDVANGNSSQKKILAHTSVGELLGRTPRPRAFTRSSIKLCKKRQDVLSHLWSFDNDSTHEPPSHLPTSFSCPRRTYDSFEPRKFEGEGHHFDAGARWIPRGDINQIEIFPRENGLGARHDTVARSR